jgi:hypothetical protein
MLEPEGRQLLLDALRPPAGYELDYAVGTTYSLDLMTLLAAPLGFALFDREASDGRLIADPIALIEAVRRHADLIDIFCQAGQIAVPREHRMIVTYLESSVHEVVPVNREAIFHPKVWVMRYRRSETGVPVYRLLCLSRNLTFDRSWDTVLCLEGEVRDEENGDLRLAEFIRRLPELGVRQMSDQRTGAVAQLAADLRSVVFNPPAGFDRVGFWPLGFEAGNWPFQGSADRMLVVSPFLTQGCLARLARTGAGNVVVSRSEAFDLVGGDALAPFAETMVVSPTALTPDVIAGEPPANKSTGPTDEALAEQAGIELRGLHAKLYVADSGRRARVWTGSANATGAAFGGNVEFLVELEGPKAQCGVEATIGERTDGVGLRKLLEPYRPLGEKPRELTPAERLERRLDMLHRTVAQQDFAAIITADKGDVYRFELRVSPVASATGGWWDRMLGSASFLCRPLSLGAAYYRPGMIQGTTVAVDFGMVSFDRLTSFFVVQVELAEGDVQATAEFVINATLIGAPQDRRERTLVTLLENRRDLIRFLLLLLDQSGADDLSFAIEPETGAQASQGGTWLFAQWQSLLEPMIHALASDPARLDEISRLMAELEATEAGRRLLPNGWRAVWQPIWQAREELRTR